MFAPLLIQLFQKWTPLWRADGRVGGWCGGGGSRIARPVHLQRLLPTNGGIDPGPARGQICLPPRARTIGLGRRMEAVARRGAAPPAQASCGRGQVGALFHSSASGPMGVRVEEAQRVFRSVDATSLPRPECVRGSTISDTTNPL